MSDRIRVGEIFRGGETGLQWVVSDVDSSGEPLEYGSDGHTMRVTCKGAGRWGIVTNLGAFVRRGTDAAGRRGHPVSFPGPVEAMAFVETLSVDPNHMARYGGGLPGHVKSKIHEASDTPDPVPAP